MGRLKKRTLRPGRFQKNGPKKRALSRTCSQDQSQLQASLTDHEHRNAVRGASPLCPVASMEESKPVVVEPTSTIELTEIPSRSCQATPSPREDVGHCAVSYEGSKLPSPSHFESRCLKVTFNPEKQGRSDCKGRTTGRGMSISPRQQDRSSTAPSKDDVLSIVIEKLTELVKDSEKRQSASVRSTPSTVCGSRRAASPTRADPFYKCPKCPCLFALNAKQAQSKEAVLCECCEKAWQTEGCRAGDGGKRTVQGQPTGYPTTGERSRVKCELCSHVAGSYYQLLHHLLSKHADAKICKCKLCDFFTTIEARIQEHTTVHNAPHLYKCSSCPFVTDKLCNLQGHMKDHNKDRELLLKCSECGFSCRCEDILRTHMWEHIPSIRKTSARTQKPDPSSSDENKSPSVPSPADGEQPYIFKCLLCGYLCDRLATLKAHAWRHAGEKGCSYPVVDEDECLKQSLSSAPTKAFPSAGTGKAFPLAIFSGTKSGSVAEMPKVSSFCEVVSDTDSTNKKEVDAGGKSRISRECCCGPGDSQEEKSGCRCEGINIPPSSVPLIKKLLIQKKHESLRPKTTDETEDDKKTLAVEQVCLSASEAENHSHNPSTLHENNSSSCRTPEHLQNDVALTVPLPCGSLSETVQDVPGKRANSNPVDSQLVVIDPSNPQMMFIDFEMPVPEPAAEVETSTEQNLAVHPEQLVTTDDAFIPPYNRPKSVREDSTDVSSSKVLDQSLPLPEELTKISSQNAVSDRKRAQECEGKIPQRVCKKICSNLHAMNVQRRDEVEGSSDEVKNTQTDKNTHERSRLMDSLPHSVEPSSSRLGPNTSRSNQVSVSSAGKLPIVGERLDGAYKTNIVQPQEKLTETLNTESDVSSLHERGVAEKLPTFAPEMSLRCMRSVLPEKVSLSKCEQMACGESTLVGKEFIPHRTGSNIDRGEGSFQITKQSDMSQEMQINSNAETESPFDSKRVCHPVTMQGINTQSTTEGQMGPVTEQESELEKKSKAILDMNSEEDSIVKFFMNIVKDSGRPFQCKLCSKTYEGYSSLKQHLQTHLVHNSFRCPLCKECFESLDNLKRHIMEHYKELHNCSECPAFFYTKSELQAHRQSHMVLKEFKCDECSVTISGQAEFISHCETVHSNRGKSCVRCTHCGEGFCNTNALLLHTLSCTMRKMRCCKECSFATETTDGLQAHIKDCHLRPKLYKCDLCDYKSSAKNGIKNHMKFHAKDKPYKCQLCNFTGAYPQSLRSHMRMHSQPDWRPDCLTSELPEQYKCKLCCYTCNYLPSLKSHMWRHASDPSYSYKGNRSTSSSAPTTTSSDAPATVSGTFPAPLVITTQQQSTRVPIRISPALQEPQQVPGVVRNLVTFCCQECGFQSTDRGKLVEHLKTHIPSELLEAERKQSQEARQRKTRRGSGSAPSVGKESQPTK